MEQWILPRLNNIVMSSILLHNIMVEHCVINDEHESAAVYNVFDDAATDHAEAVPNDETIAWNNLAFHGQVYNDLWKRLMDEKQHYFLCSCINRELLDMHCHGDCCLMFGQH
jgi:hypothetical protein